MELKTQPNENRCSTTRVTHILSLPECCPMTKNPRTGSKITISYIPDAFIIEVASLRKYIDSYVGGRGNIRSMEGMIQNITQDCSDCIHHVVSCKAQLILQPDQEMIVDCTAYPKSP